MFFQNQIPLKRGFLLSVPDFFFPLLLIPFIFLCYVSLYSLKRRLACGFLESSFNLYKIITDALSCNFYYELGISLKFSIYYTLYVITFWSFLSGDSVWFSLVTELCPTLCDPMDCSLPGFPVHQQLLEFTQTHVHRVGDAIQPSHPLLSPSPPTFNLSQHQGLFQ